MMLMVYGNSVFLFEYIVLFVEIIENLRGFWFGVNWEVFFRVYFEFSFFCM